MVIALISLRVLVLVSTCLMLCKAVPLMYRKPGESGERLYNKVNTRTNNLPLKLPITSDNSCYLNIIVISGNQLLTICWSLTDLTGGRVPLSYKLNRYVPLQRVWSLVPKMGIDFAHFGLELGVVFKRTVEVYEHIYSFNSKWTREKDYFAIRKGF